MPKVTYTSHKGETFEFTDYVSLGTAAPIRGGSWSYELERRNIRAQQHEPKAEKAEITVTDMERFEQLQYLADTDMAAAKPGTLEVDGWTVPAYITSAEPKEIKPNLVMAEAEILRLDTWSRSSRVTGQLTNHGALDADFKAIITGPATNPSFTIAGNKYQLDYEIPAGATVEIQSRYKTVQYQQGGTYRNLFQYAHREPGENMFQGIPHGTHSITKSGSWDLNLTIYENRGSLPWTL